MIGFSLRGARNWFCAVMATALLFSSGLAAALEYNDIVVMKQNALPDEVIVNMIRDGGGVELTSEQESQLRGMGFSEPVLAAARMSRPVPSAASVPVQVIETPQPVTVHEPLGPTPITMTAQLPARYAKEGWISVSNTGWESYFMAVDQKAKRIFLSQTPNGGIEIIPGENVALNVRKEGYKMYGNNGKRLNVKVRENEVTRITLIPFGVPGGGILNVSCQDRERVRSEILFGVFVTAPPAVIVEPAPAVIVEPAPVFIHPGPHYRRHYPGPRW